MNAYMERMFRYDRWATELVAGAMATADVIDTKALEYLAHMYWAQQMWIHRIGGPYEKPADLWALKRLDACVADGAEMTKAWIAILETCELETPITFTTVSDNVTYTHTIGEIVTHVVNHGTHHRAQISSILRGQGVTPPGTDYIFYLRTLQPEGS